MPEGPECHVIAHRLGEMLCGHQLVHVDVLSPGFADPEPLNSHLAAKPATATTVAAKGKLIHAVFDNGYTMLSTLGLRGSWTAIRQPNCRAALCLRDQYQNEKRIFYCDPINYGTMKFVQTDFQLRIKLRSLGPDVVTASQAPDGYGECTPAWWLDLCKRKGKWSFPKLLMKQSYLAGVGNYIKAEALYQSHISPLLPIHRFSRERQLAVLDAVLDVVRRSYAWKAHQAKLPGHTEPVETYVHKVYGRGVDPQGRRVEKTQTDDGRTTYWVREAQMEILRCFSAALAAPEPGFEESTVVARQLMQQGPPFPKWLADDLRDDSKMAEDVCLQKNPESIELTLPPAKTA